MKKELTEISTSGSVQLAVQFAGQDGYENLVLAQGTEHEIEINYGKPFYLNDGNAKIFRALIQEVQDLKKTIELLQVKP